MNPFAELSDKRLLENSRRLERDIQDFDRRANRQKAILERQRRFSSSEPLYQRLTSIRDQLRADLRRAEDEIERRRRSRSARPSWSLRSAVTGLLGAPS
jgi:hypothetical protein